MKLSRHRFTGRESRSERRVQALIPWMQGGIGLLFLFLLFAGGRPSLAQTPSGSSESDFVAQSSDQTADSLLEKSDTLERTSPTQESESPRAVAKRVNTYHSILRREKPFVYESGGRRDPFRPLIWEGKKGQDIVTNLLVLDGAVLTGVVWSEGEYLAMVRDKNGRTFFLRDGDSVFRGRVVSVSQTKAVFQLAEFGEVERVTLTVRANEGGKGNQ
jgi:hypothetical protein